MEPVELTETVLADGESRLEFLGGYAGERDRPLPRTLPPPSFRADMFFQAEDFGMFQTSNPSGEDADKPIAGLRCLVSDAFIDTEGMKSLHKSSFI